MMLIKSIIDAAAHAADGTSAAAARRTPVGGGRTIL